jgi:predicted nucleotidyltransferase component of viral defense system
MIDRREILEAASSFSLLPNVVEKDYFLGWVLAGINAHEELAESWLFKGGTCLKKCYFKTYRFSEDLDFTLPMKITSTRNSCGRCLRRIAMLRLVWRIRAHEVLNAE